MNRQNSAPCVPVGTGSFAGAWEVFFRPGTEVVALPNWSNPRVYIPADAQAKRWRDSGLFRVSGVRGSAFRLAMTLKTALRTGESRTVTGDTWHLGEYLRDTLPGVEAAYVSVGGPGPTQKLISQLRDSDGEVRGYLKYARGSHARMRIEHEYGILSELPVGVGPAPLGFDSLRDGLALLVEPVAGRGLRRVLPPPRTLPGFVEELCTGDGMEIEDHPWIRRSLRRGDIPAGALESLSGRRWRVAMQHGDLAPWNMISGTDGSLRAIDWEYGDLEGFPFLDAITYFLQVAKLSYRLPAKKSAKRVVEYLASEPGYAVTADEAAALVRLTAHDGYLMTVANNHPSGWYGAIASMNQADLT